MELWIGAALFTVAVSGIIWALVAIDRMFFGDGEDDVEDIPDGSGEPAGGKYTRDEIPFN